MDAYTAFDMDIRAVDPAALVDIRDVKVNTALPKRERILDFIRQIGNPYCYRHGKYVVRVSFAEPSSASPGRSSLSAISSPRPLHFFSATTSLFQHACAYPVNCRPPVGLGASSRAAT